MSDKNKCETCKWWDDREDGAPTANCCVFPQRIKTNGQYFCGQWGAKGTVGDKKLPALIKTVENAMTLLDRAGDNYGIVRYVLRPAVEAAK